MDKATDLWSLEGQCALVTGASRGIGVAIAGALAERARALSAVGNRLDILVNNAGFNLRKSVLDYSSSEVAAILETNLHAAFELARAAWPQLKAYGHASIVNISSVAGLTHLRTGVPYAMSKAAPLTSLDIVGGASAVQPTCTFGQVGAGGHRHAQRCIDLVGDTGNQLSERGQLFRLQQLLLGGLQLGQCLFGAILGLRQLGGPLGQLLLQPLCSAQLLGAFLTDYAPNTLHDRNGKGDGGGRQAELQNQRQQLQIVQHANRQTPV